MKDNHSIILSLLLSLLTSFTIQFAGGIVVPLLEVQDLIFRVNHRRILHEPLFQEGSTPPPALESEPLLPPPSSPDFSGGPDQPFFPEVPTGPTPDQVQQPPVPANGVSKPGQSATPQPDNPTKKVAVAVSVGVVTLGMLSALAFYMYRQRSKHPGETQKLVGGNSQSQRSNDETRVPPNTFLYVGTVVPSNQGSVSETNGCHGSPYQKLSSLKRSERYRPSPELQPLPPLNKLPPPPPAAAPHSPPPMSSSDEESHETSFYTPQGSTLSNDEGTTYIPRSRHSTLSSNNTVPHSKRTSPSRRHTIIPSVKKPPIPPPPPPPPPPLAPLSQGHKVQNGQINNRYPPKRTKFSAPPPPPDMKKLQSISNQTTKSSDMEFPPPKLTPWKLECSETNIPRTLPSFRNSPSKSPKSRTTSEKTLNFEDSNAVFSSSGNNNDGDDIEGSKPRLRPLHWDKVRATSDRAMVWDQIRSSSFQLNEDMMETLFGCNSANSASKEAPVKSVFPAVKQENRVLDPKKSQNIAIMLRALNVTRDEVSEALLDGNSESLGVELLETLEKMAPTKEEEIKLREYGGDVANLGSAERFLKTILDIPFAFKRIEAMLYRANFDAEIKYLRKSFQTLEIASEELKNSRLFLKLLEAVLRTGNRMNVGTNRGQAEAFKLDTLLKLVDIKGTDGKTTLLHFVVQEIIRCEGTRPDMATENYSNKINSDSQEENFKKQGLLVVAGLSKELDNVKKAAGMDSDVLNSYVSKLAMGIEKIKLVLQNEKPYMQENFFKSMRMFLKEAEEEIVRVKAEERKALSMVKEVTEYFHGDAAKEEAHPLRIFMIVRDFFSVLENVCKEVGRMQDRTMVGSGRSFRIPATAALPVLNRHNVQQDRSSDDESSS